MANMAAHLPKLPFISRNVDLNITLLMDTHLPFLPFYFFDRYRSIVELLRYHGAVLYMYYSVGHRRYGLIVGYDYDCHTRLPGSVLEQFKYGFAGIVIQRPRRLIAKEPQV